MRDLKTLLSSLQKYLQANGWTIDPRQSSDLVCIWEHHQLNESIQLPTEHGLEHHRAEKTLQEAINDLSELLDVSRTKFITSLYPAADRIHIRAAGSAIEHGRINFRTNHKIESAIYSIIKNAADSFITFSESKRKSKKTKKSDFVEAYLNSVNTVVPTGGSFIYNLDIDLSRNEDFEGSESLQRYVNSKLALALNELLVIGDIDQLSTATLLQKGLNASLCNSFTNMFDSDVETIEYNFDWSDVEPAPKNLHNKLVFNRKHKDIVKKLAEKFNSSKPIPLSNAYAHLTRLDIKTESASIRLKIKLNGANRTCDATIDLETAQRLMKALGENIEQPVMIDGTAWVEKSPSRHHYSLSIDSICSEKGQNLSLLDI